jgi:CRISPR/Cas system-associated endonuclease Cas1
MGRIIELTRPGQSLRKERGFLVISRQDEVAGRIPLDDIDAVIAATPGLYWSGNLIAALAERSIPIVFTSLNYAPTAPTTTTRHPDHHRTRANGPAGPCRHQTT